MTVGTITTVVGGDPVIVTVDFDPGVEPEPGVWLSTPGGGRWRVEDARKLDSRPNRWKMRCDRLPRGAELGRHERVLLIHGRERDRRAEAAKRVESPPRG